MVYALGEQRNLLKEGNYQRIMHLHIEEECDYISILDYIVLAL